MHIHSIANSNSSRLPLLIAAAIALALATHSAAQQTAGPAAGPAPAKLVRVAIEDQPKVPAASGRQNYAAYCASCHGVTGKGDGHAAAGLKQKPTDLTQLSAKNNGKFPWGAVSNVLESAGDRPDHVSAAMPNWWQAFSAQDPGNPTKFTASVRVHNLISYLKSLQAPAH